MVVFASLIIMGGIIASLFYYLAHLQSTSYYEERLKGYYLCEVGVSKGLEILKNGGAVPQDGSVNFTLGAESYDINYRISGAPGAPIVVGSVLLPSGYTYSLRVGTKREQWPFFIKGIIPPLME